MAKRKKKEEEIPVLRKCDCWLEIDTCYCGLEGYESVRYSVVDSKKNVHSRWETLNEAMEDGRKRMNGCFSIYDNLEKKTVISYGEPER